MRLRARPAFPFGPPTWPGGVARPPRRPRTGVHYDTSWARRPAARVARALVLDGGVRPLFAALASPRTHGLDHLDAIDPPAIFAANHHSHLDTALVLASLPSNWRHKAVVAAAADYFFTSRARSAFSALTIGAIPIERTKVNRRSADIAADLLDDGWSLLIFPEGGRSPDGWGQAFQGGAAYLSLRGDIPVVPVYIEGTRKILRKGARRLTLPQQGEGVDVTFGPPLRANADEDARRFSARIERAVTALADEYATDWWSARRRAAAGASPPLTGPATAPWRRAWALEQDSETNGKPAWP